MRKAPGRASGRSKANVAQTYGMTRTNSMGAPVDNHPLIVEDDVLVVRILRDRVVGVGRGQRLAHHDRLLVNDRRLRRQRRADERADARADDRADRAANDRSHSRASERASNRPDGPVVGVSCDHRRGACRRDDRQNNRFHIRPPRFFNRKPPRPWQSERSLAANVPARGRFLGRCERRLAIVCDAKGTSARAHAFRTFMEED